MTLSCTSRRYTYSALSLAESVASNSTALRPSAYATPATKAALNNSASCLNFFIHHSLMLIRQRTECSNHRAESRPGAHNTNHAAHSGIESHKESKLRQSLDNPLRTSVTGN